MDPNLNWIERIYFRIRKFFLEDIWKFDLKDVSRFKVILVQQLQAGFMIIRSLIEDRLMVRASALVYSTLLSIVPLLAVMFSVLKAFGVHNALEPALDHLLSPSLGTNTPIIIKNIVSFVENVQVGALGSIGLAFLFFTVISVVNNVERAFNDVWHVQKVRSLRRKFTDYISIILVGPVFAFAVVGITASFQSNAIVRSLLEFEPISQVLARLVPFIVSWFIFAFLNLFVPNTPVNLTSAILGGLAGGTLWQISNWTFATIVVSSYQIGSKAVLYASFAALPLFLLWLYVGWVIVLLSAEITYVNQNIKKFQWTFHLANYSDRAREHLMLRILVLLGRNFYLAQPAYSVYSIARQLDLPPPFVAEVMQRLERVNLVTEIDGNPPTYQPGCDFSNLTVKQVLDLTKDQGESLKITGENADIDLVVKQIEQDIDRKLQQAIGHLPVHKLVLASLKSRTSSGSIQPKSI